MACMVVVLPSDMARAEQMPDEDELTRNIVLLASDYGHYGHRTITAMLYNNDFGGQTVVLVTLSSLQCAVVKCRSSDLVLHRISDNVAFRGNA